MSLTATGQPADQVLLFTSGESGFLFDAARFGVYCLGAGPAGRAAHGIGGGLAGWAPLGAGDPLLGSADGQGELSADRAWNPLPAAVEALTIHLQTVSIEAGSSNVFLGSPWTVVALNSQRFAGDCNLNGIPDTVDIANGISSDCDGDGIADDCSGWSDCNHNAVHDWCDLPFYADPDCDGNGLPDTCQGMYDCNGNGIGDACDITNGTSLDADGNGIPDECQVTRLYVDADAPALGESGLSWDHAIRSLQDGLAAAQRIGTVQEIWVAEGTYRPAPPGGDPLVSFTVPATVSLLGGFAGNETQADQRDPLAHPTILDGDLLGDDGPGFSNRDDNSEEVLRVVGGEHRVSGFVVRGGGNPSIHLSPSFGRGISIVTVGFVGSSPVTIDHCRIVDNQEGGAYTNFTTRFVSCEFVGNFHSQHAALEGRRTRVDVWNCIFVGNRTDPAQSNASTIWIYPYQGHSAWLFLRSSTVAFNEGIGIVAYGSGSEIRNSVLWGNRGNASAGTLEAEQLSWTGGTPDVRYTCIEGLSAWAGIGMIGADPLLLDPLGPDGLPRTGDEDLHLGALSPCIDAGRNGDLPEDTLDLDGDGNTTELIPFDLDGNPRRVDDPAVPDTGVGVVPITDMGAFERQGP